MFGVVLIFFFDLVFYNHIKNVYTNYFSKRGNKVHRILSLQKIIQNIKQIFYNFYIYIYVYTLNTYKKKPRYNCEFYANTAI